MPPQESKRNVMTPTTEADILRFRKQEPVESLRRASFRAKLFESINLLRKKQITQKGFFEGLTNEGDGRQVQTVVRIGGRIKAEEHDAYIGRTDDGKLLIIMPQHQLVGLPILTARVGLNEAGQLTVEEVKAQVFDEKTHQYQEAKGNIVIIDTQGVTLPKKGLGEKMLRTFISYAIPPKEYLEKLNGFATWGGKAKMSESSYGATTPRIL